MGYTPDKRTVTLNETGGALSVNITTPTVIGNAKTPSVVTAQDLEPTISFREEEAQLVVNSYDTSSNAEIANPTWMRPVDTAAAFEIISKAIAAPLGAQQSTVSDTLMTHPGKVFSDLPLIYEAVRFSASVGKLESISLTETIRKALTVFFQEMVSVSEGMLADKTMRSSGSETATVSEAMRLTVVKAVNELTIATESITKETSKLVIDTAAASEVLCYLLDKGNIDTVQTSHSVVAAMQDYFADDYVEAGYSGILLTL
jgi:hypothetical protein